MCYFYISQRTRTSRCGLRIENTIHVYGTITIEITGPIVLVHYHNITFAAMLRVEWPAAGISQAAALQNLNASNCKC